MQMPFLVQPEVIKAGTTIIHHNMLLVNGLMIHSWLIACILDPILCPKEGGKKASHESLCCASQSSSKLQQVHVWISWLSTMECCHPLQNPGKAVLPCYRLSYLKDRMRKYSQTFMKVPREASEQLHLNPGCSL